MSRFAAIAVAIALFIGLTPAAFGSETRSGILVQVSGSEVVPEDLVVACKMLEMNGEIQGDLLAGGMSLGVANTVGGDLTAGGYNIRVSGTVGDDTRLAGTNLEIDGIINGDLVAFGGNVTISGNVKGDVVTGGGNVKISGNIEGTLDARCGEMIIEGTIGQNVVLTTSRLILSSTAVLKGNLTYTSKRDADIQAGAQIYGAVNKEKSRMMIFWGLLSTIADYLPEQPENWTEWKDGLPAWFRVLLRLSSFVSLLIAGIIILSLYERHTIMVADRIISFPLKSLGLGLLFLVGIPIAALIMFTTIVGIPLGFIALATCLVFSYISRIYVALAIGREILDRITDQEVRIIWHLILGLLIITLLSLIPYFIGGIIQLVCILFGLGGMLMAGRRVRVAPKEEVIS
jgi:cytoskeletal protein CcmA (bactofilin family)